MLQGLTTADFKAVSKETLKDSVADSLRTAILDQTLRPGQRIPELQIATKLGVSRAPVRDALAVLAHEGLVNRDERGAHVVRLTRKDVDEISSLRLALERLAVQLVVRNATPADFQQMDNVIHRTAEAATAKEASPLDLKFHELMVRAAGHERLLNSWLALRSQLRLLLVQLDQDIFELPKSTASAHKKFLAVLRRGDEENAVAMLEAHLENTHQLVAAHCDESVNGVRFEV